MDCEEFQRLLDRFIAGDLDVASRDRCESHLFGCEACLQLWMSHSAEDFTLIDADALPLTRSILASAGLDPCEACEALLCDFVEGKLPTVQQSLMRRHLETCAHCRKIADALVALQHDLASLAELEAPPEVLEHVLSRTVSATKPAVRRHVPWDFKALIARPRFALESAFVATLACVMVFGIPDDLRAGRAQTSMVSGQAQVHRTLARMRTNLDETVDEARLKLTKSVGSVEDYADERMENMIEIVTRAGDQIWMRMQGGQERSEDPSEST
ncbi:MAG: zf-HC2 domain-containing protein [Gammaproteobacteria bacterium]|jgi:anti-sigma factor RsiW